MLHLIVQILHIASLLLRFPANKFFRLTLQAEYPVSALRGHKFGLGNQIYSGKILTKF